MSGILAKKIGMTQLFSEDGCSVPVTVLESVLCAVIQVKTVKKDGYNAVQLGIREIKEAKTTKPLCGHFKKAKVNPKGFIREIRVDEPQDYKAGQQINVSIFSQGDYVDITGTTKGRGFQGGVKRWNWSGGPDTHGSMSHRVPGSIGASSFPSRVVKGHHLPGHMGSQRLTQQNMEVIKVDKDNNLLVVKGSVCGHNNSYVIIKKSRKKQSKK